MTRRVWLPEEAGTVVHCKRDSYDVYIGRPSIFGNPFEIGKDGTRDEVIEKYGDWVVNQSDIIGALPQLWGKTLGCWCKPKACHGDVLLNILAEMRYWFPHYFDSMEAA